MQRRFLLIDDAWQVIVKQLSSFDVTKVAFIDRKDVSRGIVSVGKENIRFWWMKGKKRDEVVLASHTVYLGEHARDTIFTDIAIAKTDENVFKVLVVANTGNLYIVDASAEKEMIGMRRKEACSQRYILP